MLILRIVVKFAKGEKIPFVTTRLDHVKIEHKRSVALKPLLQHFPGQHSRATSAQLAS